MHSLYLKPWDTKTSSDFKIHCGISKVDSRFEIRFDFSILGPLSKLQGIPESSQLESFQPLHIHETLWKTTCLEVFLGLEDSKEYWEWNLAPDLSSYACFYFSEERKRETSLKTSSHALKPFHLLFQKISPEEALWSFHLDFSFWSKATWKKDLNPSQIKMGLNMILEFQKGIQSFWAIQHPLSDRPDFHLASNRKLHWSEVS